MNSMKPSGGLLYWLHFFKSHCIIEIAAGLYVLCLFYAAGPIGDQAFGSISKGHLIKPIHA